MTVRALFVSGAGMRLVDEVRAAVGALTRVPVQEFPPEVRLGGLAWWPLVGLAQGGLATAAAVFVGRLEPVLAGAAGVLALELLGGGRPVSRGPMLAVGARAVQLWAVTGLPVAGQTAALLLGPLLGRWAEVVQCHGGRALGPGVACAAPIGRARFREFGAASLAALGLTMTIARGIGLLVAVLAAAVLLTIRVASFRRRGGITPAALAASGAVVEAVPFVVLAGLA